MLKNINLNDGKITYNDFHIDPHKSFKEQEWDYKENMLRIKYNDRYLIDVGWYPEFNPKGFFTTVVVDNCDWDNPLFKKRTRSVKRLLKHLHEAIQLASNISKNVKQMPKCPH